MSIAGNCQAAFADLRGIVRAKALTLRIVMGIKSPAKVILPPKFPAKAAAR
jgi:hypothetical protein